MSNRVVHAGKSFSVNNISKLADKLSKRRTKYDDDNNQYPMAVFAYDSIGRSINLNGFYERETLDFLIQFLDKEKASWKDMQMLDIGANIGNHTRYFADMFKTIYCFEPNPDVYELLRLNTKYYSGVKTFNIGLSDENSQLNLSIVKGNVGASKISDVTSGNHVSIDVKRLDDLDINLDNLGLIKIDVEGHELKALKGFESIIKASMPIILFEQSKDEFKEGGSPVINYLESLGYKFTWQHKPKGWEKKINSVLKYFRPKINKMIYGDKVPAMYHSLIVAVPPSKDYLLK